MPPSEARRRPESQRLAELLVTSSESAPEEIRVAIRRAEVVVNQEYVESFTAQHAEGTASSACQRSLAPPHHQQRAEAAGQGKQAVRPRLPTKTGGASTFTCRQTIALPRFLDAVLTRLQRDIHEPDAGARGRSQPLRRRKKQC